MESMEQAAAIMLKALQEQAQRELDDSGQGNSVGETGFVEGMIPVWGSGRDLVNDIQTGDVGGAILNGGFLVWDVASIVVGVFTFGGGTVAMQVTAGQKHLYGRQYTWGDGMRLANTLNTLTGDSVNYNYDTFGSLKAATYNDKETLYKNPDAAGNLYRSKDRSDRVYGHGGKLLKDREWLFYYDAQGNLVLKTKFITIEGQEPLWRQGDWAYEWYANGMLKNVRRPDGGLVSFEYDALGRRTAKIVNTNPLSTDGEGRAEVYRYMWDGNVLLHEWSYSPGQRPKLVVNEDGTMAYDKEEPVEGVVTWVYERGSYVPCAKIVGEEKYSIISDYLGRPVQAYDADGKVAWQADYDIYGKPRSLKGAKSFIPFRQLGQYEDEEVALYYNRFRYYDAEQGNYISQDPIGLDSGEYNLYRYVHDVNSWVDIFGLWGEGDVAPYGSSLHKNDGMEAHELLRNKFLQNLGLAGKNRNRQNPSIALSPTSHDIAHSEEFRLRNAMGLGNNDMLKRGKFEIRMSAQAINNTLVANGTITIDQLRIARKLAENFAKQKGCF